MPELPEVETIRQTLKTLVIDRTIDQVTVHWDNIVKLPDVHTFKKLLVGQTIRNINRQGKFLLFEFDDYVLVSHLRMEGKYSVHQQDESLDKHTHIIFTFSNGEDLRYNDVRKFGTMHVFKKGEETNNKPLNQLGPEPFDQQFTFDYFSKRLKRTRRAIKAVLLDQTIVAGLGNIYVDETLYKARVHPTRRASTLSDQEIKAIQVYAKETLKDAIAQGGTTIRSYVNSQGDMGMFQQELFVYGQEDEPCEQCGDMIVKIRVSGRGTHVCNTCQKGDFT